MDFVNIEQNPYCITEIYIKKKKKKYSEIRERFKYTKTKQKIVIISILDKLNIQVAFQ